MLYLIFFLSLVSWAHPLETWPVLHEGRVKPLESFARENLLFLTGKEYFKADPVEDYFYLLEDKQRALQIPLLKVSSKTLREQLGLSDKARFSVEEIAQSSQYHHWLENLIQSDLDKEHSATLEEARRLRNKMARFFTLIDSQEPSVFYRDGKWLRKKDLSLEEAPILEDWKEADRFGNLSASLISWKYPHLSSIRLKAELLFWKLHPLRFALIALGFCLFFSLLPFQWTQRIQAAFFHLALFFQSFHIVLRCIIAGRPPVSNMYESILWVAFGLMVIGLFYRKSFPILRPLAALGSMGLLFLAQSSPELFPPYLDPLQPVLDSQLWLSIHVLVVVFSYAGFALSMLLANFFLWNTHWRKQKLPLDWQNSLHRIVQISLVLLIAGTFLGGLWADYSWGRFWGWDPKETWAAISILVYLAILHGKKAGILRESSYWGALLAGFQAILMTWYGVNFILGVGLHSYGFGTGAIQWVLAYLFIQAALAVSFVMKKSKKEMAL